MIPTQAINIENKIDRLEKKLDFMIHHYIQQQEDWINDPMVITYLERLVKETQKTPLLTEEKVFGKK